MADAPVSSLARAREQKIEELAAHFANDDLSLEDLERRIELVYKASNVAELDHITQDLRSALIPAPANALAPSDNTSVASHEPTPYELASSRILAFMSSTKRVGRWALTRHTKLKAVMADTTIDLTQAVLPPGLSEIDIRAVMSSVKIIVLPGVRVINDANSIMADITNRADDLSDQSPRRGPTIRISGYAFLSELKITVRARETALLESVDEP